MRRRSAAGFAVLAAVWLVLTGAGLWMLWRPAAVVATDAAFSRSDLPALSVAELEARDITRISAGTLDLPTGRIVVTDPFEAPSRAPLVRAAPKGSYEVEAYRQRAGPRAVGLAVVRFSDEPVTRWQMARTEEVADVVRDGERWQGHTIASGAGALGDPAAFAALEAGAASRLRDMIASPRIALTEMRPAGPATPRLIALRLPDRARGAAVSYWGFDTNGDLAALAVDYQVF